LEEVTQRYIVSTFVNVTVYLWYNYNMQITKEGREEGREEGRKEEMEGRKEGRSYSW
jgi:predicted transposase YdaD